MVAEAPYPRDLGRNPSRNLQPGMRPQYAYQGDRGPPMTITKALREKCGINPKAYIALIVTEEGQVCYFSDGPVKFDRDDNSIRSFINEDAFLESQKLPRPSMLNRVSSSTHGGPVSTFEEPLQRPRRMKVEERSQWSTYERRHSGYGDFTGEYGGSGRRKRLRAQRLDDEPRASITTTKRPIKIGDSKDVEAFYDQRFKKLQQTACKIIAKAWIKAVHPKKQSQNPYTKGEDAAPDWWPKPWGTSSTERVTHVEPDHQNRKERVRLLVHILRMVVEPSHKQHPAIQKVNLDVLKLEELTAEAMHTWFADKDKPKNAEKKPYLDDLFEMAKAEARYLDGEVDRTYVVYVAADERMLDDDASDDEQSQTKDDEVTKPPSSRISPQRSSGSTSQHSPHSLISAQMSATSTMANSPVGNLQGGSFLEIPGRQTAAYDSSMMHTNMGASQQQYIDEGNMAVGGQPPVLQTQAGMTMAEMMPNPHDQSRRASMFNSHADFQTSPTSGLYHATSWTTGSTAPPNPSLYASYGQSPAATPQPQSAASYVTQSNVPSFMGSFDGMPRTYESTHANMYRGAGNIGQQSLALPSMAQATMAQPQEYASYMGNENHGLADENLKMEAHMHRDQRH